MFNALLHNKVVNWDDIEQTEIRPGVRRRIYSTEEVMLCWHELDKGMEIRPHSHEDFDQLALILEGRCDYYVGGVAHPMGPGDMLLVPAGSPHHIVPVTEHCVNLDVFAPPREDYLPLVREQLRGQG